MLKKILREKDGRKGTTLIELMIVMLVIAALLAIAWPSYNTWMAKLRVRNAINRLIVIKKGIKSMTNQCKGQPMRSSINDAMEFMEIIDLTECGNSGYPGDRRFTIWPNTEYECEGVSLGKQLGVESVDGKNALCRSACEFGENCKRSEHRFFSDVFVNLFGDPCSPSYGSAPYNGGSPGWNYRLLYDSPINTPVGVLCAVAEGKGTPVKIIINTEGFYSGVNVSEGSAYFGINGETLGSSGCTCGPACEEVTTGRRGCCAPCQGNPGIGYSF